MEIQAAPECSTNLVVHEYGATCIAILDIAQQKVLGGSATKQELMSFKPLADGWLKLIIRLPLTRSFHVYLGIADGQDLIYDGHAQAQFLLRNTIFVRLE